MIENNAKPILKKKGKTWPKWPIKMTPELVQRLEEAFTYGLTDEEACLSVDISTSIFYEYQGKNPKFKERKEELKKMPNMHAKKVWVKEITGGNYQASKEWLERRSKDEFSLKIETKNETDVNMSVEVSGASDEELDKLING